MQARVAVHKYNIICIYTRLLDLWPDFNYWLVVSVDILSFISVADQEA